MGKNEYSKDITVWNLREPFKCMSLGAAVKVKTEEKKVIGKPALYSVSATEKSFLPQLFRNHAILCKFLDEPHDEINHIL